MRLKIALMALAVTLIAGVAVTLFLLKFYKKRMDSIGKSEAPENPSDVSDWNDWKHDEWAEDWKDEWNDWEIWDKKQEEKR